MQKLMHSRIELLRPVTLYLEDIEQIVEILQQVSGKVELHTEEYVLEDLEQLAELKSESINEFHIMIRDPFISLELMPYRIDLYIEKDEPMSRGLFEQIKQILASRRRPYAWLIQAPFFTGLLSGLGIIALVFSMIGFVKGAWFSSILGTVFAGFTLLWAWNGYRDGSERYSIIVLKHKIHASSFFKENLDAIAVALVVSILSLIIGYVFGKITGGIP
jgi:hypothetical protein